MQGKKQVACVSLPLVDQALSSLVSLHSSILGKAIFHGRNIFFVCFVFVVCWPGY